VELLFICVHAFLQWNKPSIDFYEQCLGAMAMSEWMGMRLEEQGIDNLKKLAVGAQDPS
jgi:hypothetical protein